MRSWLRGSAAAKLSASSSKNASSNHVASPQEQENFDLEHAMVAAGLIMNDDIEGAEAGLRDRQDASSFHQLGLGMTTFMRSVLGFEKDIMAEATLRLVECETRSWTDMKKAQKQAEGGSSWLRGGSSTNDRATSQPDRIYPPGSEFQLVNAEAQLMGAVISVMHESLTEGIKGFYKLRKAFIALDAIMQAEERALAAKRANGSMRSLTMSTTTTKQPVVANGEKASESDSDLDFVDAAERVSGTQTPAAYAGHLARVNSSSAPSSPVLEKNLAEMGLDTATVSAPPSRPHTPSGKHSSSPLQTPKRHTPLEDGGLDSSLFTNPVDIFVHSGTSMCFGILLLIISMVPPAFSKLLYIIGFKGDRDRGVSMLWQATKFPNINGGLAGLMLLGYYNGMLAFADILPSDEDVEELSDKTIPGGEIVGYPKERCTALLERMRVQYPESRLWKLEEARVLANTRKLDEAIALLMDNTNSKMRQVTALNNFELSLNSLFSMKWQPTKDGFLRCVELNDWSHALYYYFVGCAELEMYRDAFHAARTTADEKDRQTLETEAKKHKKMAEEYLRKCPSTAGRKKFMARQMPFEVFAVRKLQKLEERAKELGIDLADAVGVSAAQEMVYLWNGSQRMSGPLLEKALLCLGWDRCTASKEHVEKMQAEADEAAIHGVCQAAFLNMLKRYSEAHEVLAPILEQDR